MYSCCLVPVSVMCLFHRVPCVRLQCVILVFPCITQLPFGLKINLQCFCCISLYSYFKNLYLDAQVAPFYWIPGISDG